MEYLGVDDCPVINIIPDEHQIYSVLAKLVADMSLIPLLKQKSRQYVEKYHDASVIAQEFIRAYQNDN
jgi:hypothetical protein